MQIDALVRSKRKTIALIVQVDGSLLVRAPLRATQAQIEAVIHDNLDWIHTKQEKARTSYRTLRPKAYQPGESFPYLGQGYPLHIVEGQRTALLFKDAFYLSHQALPRVKEVFTAWYKKQAAVLVNQRDTGVPEAAQGPLQRASRMSARPDERLESITVDPENPWLGLSSYTEETRAYFHGRDEEAAELARRVQRKNLTVLFGQSGLGKTSLLRAGLVPRLRGEGFCPVYVRVDYSPDTPPPAEQIKQAIFRATAEAGHWSRPGTAIEGESLWEFLHHRGDLLRDASGRTLQPLLIFDQFEEIFTLAQADDAGRQRAKQFIEDLADVHARRRGQ